MIRCDVRSDSNMTSRTIEKSGDSSKYNLNNNNNNNNDIVDSKTISNNKSHNNNTNIRTGYKNPEHPLRPYFSYCDYRPGNIMTQKRPVLVYDNLACGQDGRGGEELMFR